MGVYLTSGTNWATSNVPASSIDPASQEALQVLAISDVEKPMTVKAGGDLFRSRSASGNTPGEYGAEHSLRI